MNEHPWKNACGLAERKRLHKEMREWIKANQDKRLHMGDRREDGMVFLGYGYGYENGENWTDEETFKRRRKHAADKVRELRKTPEYRAKYNAYIRDRYQKSPKHREAMRLRALKHRAEKPENNRASSMRRYVAKWKQTHPQLNKEIERGLYAEAARLTAETGIEFHVDHIIPIKHGGWHHHENLQILPYWVNNRKSTDPFWRSKDMAFRDWRDVPAELWPDGLRNEYSKQMRREPDYLLTG